MGYVERLILSNGLALVCFPLVVFNNIRTNRGRMLNLSTAMMMLFIAVYAIIGCFDAVASTLFSVLRNYACLKFGGRRGALPSRWRSFWPGRPSRLGAAIFAAATGWLICRQRASCSALAAIT